MCGLVGFLSLKRKDGVLHEMLSIQSYRGPDDNGYFIDNDTGVHLGHNRLSIQDLSSNGHQPFISNCENYILVFNGEIYNYKEIRSDLIKLGYVFLSGSETDLAINANYHSGFKKLLKWLYVFIEYPAFYIYKRDLKKAIKKSELICNSKYMADKLMQLYNKKSYVEYPFVDIDRLKNDFNNLGNEIIDKGVVFVGDSPIKGLEVAKEIALLMPSIDFYFFSRYIKGATKINNITWMPWQKNEADIYKYAKVVISPSIWEEAYGRVSREAFLLNIPVLVSNRGGLPETVDGKQNYIVEDYLNPEIWKEKIENFL